MKCPVWAKAVCNVFVYKDKHPMLAISKKIHVIKGRNKNVQAWWCAPLSPSF